ELDVDQIYNLPRKTLQALCKQYHLKANGKNAEMIQELIELKNEEDSQLTITASKPEPEYLSAVNKRQATTPISKRRLYRDTIAGNLGINFFELEDKFGQFVEENALQPDDQINQLPIQEPESEIQESNEESQQQTDSQEEGDQVSQQYMDSQDQFNSSHKSISQSTTPVLILSTPSYPISADSFVDEQQIELHEQNLVYDNQPNDVEITNEQDEIEELQIERLEEGEQVQEEEYVGEEVRIQKNIMNRDIEYKLEEQY
ncbi:MAG: hypothetical protein EZS28_043512, partial [Streblomastix strix]